MCGIVLVKGIEQAKRMLSVLAHRGKDAREICEVGKSGWFVGQNRLQIYGGVTARQPLVTNFGLTVTTFNGEIFNIKELGELGYNGSEVQVIENLMREHGEFDRLLDGYYGIIRAVAYAPTAPLIKVTISRDLLGVIPLYFKIEKDSLVAVASERKAFEGQGGVREVRAGETISFYGVGHSSRIFDPYSLHLEDMDLEHLEFLFKRAVKRRVTHSEVPVTVALSGGLDSGLVLWACAQLRLNVDAITVGLDPESDEVRNAEKIAKLAGVPWKFVQLAMDVVDEEKEKILYHLEDYTENPIKWRGMLRNYYVAKNASGTVILCGEGADEIGCGYPSHQKLGNSLGLEWKALSTIRSMPAINLDRVNKGGMAWTKEFRTPFLDRALVLYMLSCRKKVGKEYFRELARKMGVPNFVIEKEKYGLEEKVLEALR